MKLKGPRWLWIAEALLLAAALAAIGYKAAMWVRPLGAVHVGTPANRTDPMATAFDNMRNHPEGFIRIEKESWRYDSATGSAVHAFTLRNNATVAYESVVLRFDYSSPAGRLLVTRTAMVPGRLRPGEGKSYRDVRVPDVPASSDQVIVRVVSASAG